MNEQDTNTNSCPVALVIFQGGNYEIDASSLGDMFQVLAEGVANAVEAEHRIRGALGAKAVLAVSYDNVILPLAVGLKYAVGGEAREAVLNAGNAIENFLTEYGAAQNVALGGAHGINAKIDRLKGSGKMPTKHAFKGKYLGHVRNAADHGVDQEIGAPPRCVSAPLNVAKLTRVFFMSSR